MFARGRRRGPAPLPAHAPTPRRCGASAPTGPTRASASSSRTPAAAPGARLRGLRRRARAGGAVAGIAVPGAGGASRKQLDTWTAWAKEAGAKGLVWIKRESGGGGDLLGAQGARRGRLPRRWPRPSGAQAGDAALLVADARRRRARACWERCACGSPPSSASSPQERWDLLWVEEFPLFEWDAGRGRAGWPCHHPVHRAPLTRTSTRSTSDPGPVRAQAYDSC